MHAQFGGRIRAGRDPAGALFRVKKQATGGYARLGFAPLFLEPSRHRNSVHDSVGPCEIILLPGVYVVRLSPSVHCVWVGYGGEGEGWLPPGVGRAGLLPPHGLQGHGRTHQEDVANPRGLLYAGLQQVC